MKRINLFLDRMLSNERGVAIVLVVASMLAVMSAAALAIDMGLLLTARVESQRVADSSALAGASALRDDPDDSTGAVSRAIDYASQNTIRGTPATVLAEDVEVMLAEAKVRVYVQNTRDRNNEIGTFFSRVFGVRGMNVRTMATAEAAPSNGVEPTGAWGDCLLPMGILDCVDTNGDGYCTEVDQHLDLNDLTYQGDVIKMSFSGSAPAGPPQCEGEPSPPVINANPDVDWCNAPDDSWSCWWRTDPLEGGGSTDLGAAILGQNCPSINEDQVVYQASAGGEKTSLIQSDYESGGPGSYRDLIEMDPDLVWCPAGAGGSEYGCAQRGGCDGECVTDSPRLRVAPTLDWTSASGTGANNTFTVTGLVGVMIDKVACSYNLGQFGGPAGNWEVYIRLFSAGAPGAGNGPSEDEGEATLYRYLRLVE